MVVATIIIDKDLLNNDITYDKFLIKCVENHINDLIQHNGYVYLNQIYEYLFVGWNPDNDNVCIKKKKELRTYVTFEVFVIMDGSLLLLVHDYN